MRDKVRVITTRTVVLAMGIITTTVTNKGTEVAIKETTPIRTTVRDKTTSIQADQGKVETTSTKVDQDKVEQDRNMVVLTIEEKEDLLRIKKNLLKRKSKIKSKQHLLV
ncbi:hypothetical protein D3C86_1137330 [compost metagenome]